MMCLKRLLAEELQLVDEQAVDQGHILIIPKLVYQGAHDGDIDPGCSELVETVGVFDTVDDLSSDTVYRAVDWKICIRIRWARVVALIDMEFLITQQVLVFPMTIEPIHGGLSILSDARESWLSAGFCKNSGVTHGVGLRRGTKDSCSFIASLCHKCIKVIADSDLIYSALDLSKPCRYVSFHA